MKRPLPSNQCIISTSLSQRRPGESTSPAHQRRMIQGTRVERLLRRFRTAGASDALHDMLAALDPRVRHSCPSTWRCDLRVASAAAAIHDWKRCCSKQNSTKSTNTAKMQDFPNAQIDVGLTCFTSSADVPQKCSRLSIMLYNQPTLLANMRCS